MNTLAIPLENAIYRGGQSTENCSICTNDFEDGEVLKGHRYHINQFGEHMFHKICLDAWIAQCEKVNKIQAFCPNCSVKFRREEDLPLETQSTVSSISHTAEVALSQVGQLLFKTLNHSPIHPVSTSNLFPKSNSRSFDWEQPFGPPSPFDWEKPFGPPTTFSFSKHPFRPSGPPNRFDWQGPFEKPLHFDWDSRLPQRSYHWDWERPFG